MLKVAKFGGSSLSCGERIKNAAEIILSDKSRKVVVVSAPGKRSNSDEKITDLLYAIDSCAKKGTNFDKPFALLAERFIEIGKTLGSVYDIEKLFYDLKKTVSRGAPLSYTVSRGEYYNAVLIAEYIGFTFVDAAEVILFDYNGKINYDASSLKLREKMLKGNGIVVPGFYGAYSNGIIKLFARGGSDVTGAILSRLVSADVYENWTDVPGVLCADPRIVQCAKKIPEITYERLRELSHYGANVLQENTVAPVKEAGIPINVRSTVCPDDGGTLILPQSTAEKINAERKNFESKLAVCIAGKLGCLLLSIKVNGADKKIKVLKNALAVLHSSDISVERVITETETVTFLIDKKANAAVDFNNIAKKLAAHEDVTDVLFDGDVCTVGVVKNLASCGDVFSLALSALHKNNISVKAAVQGNAEFGILICLAEKDFEKSIMVIYENAVLHE